MRNQDEASGGPAWTAGEITLGVEGKGLEADRIIQVGRPFALIGQAPECDVCLAEPGVGSRHVYLHLDARGLFAVDLVTRTGTRIDGTVQAAGWLRPGQGVEVAGRRVEVLELAIDGTPIDPPPCLDDPLFDDHGPGALASVTLTPKRSEDGPWTLNSELVFLGGSSHCGIQLRDPNVAKIHCALVRTPSAAFVVDLCGHHTWVGNRTVRGASLLSDRDVLTIGTTSFAVQLEPARPGLPALSAGATTMDLIPLVALEPEVVYSLDSLPAGVERSLLAWLMESLRENQGAILRQQSEMQAALLDQLRRLQQDNAALLNAHLARVEKIDRELESLRAELARRPDGPAPAPPQLQAPAPPSPPQVTPLRITKPPEPTGATAPTTWLLDRVSQLEDEHRSAWKDLLGRLSPASRPTP